MASQQAYQAYQQNKGTLVAGQTILVNHYTVQVERYLSQGGFAHVYLVRTPAPVYNTTHHVLKRIAVANEAMLTEVKKEVDIMRLLKGHPNIVHFIDAAWHRMPNGTFEVFILMEYCPGGGIIDMMNRRLRERLTEAEILQIFVDVCEGVAYMHNSRPPLLHRDLKVENILQSSPVSFKLCDFGSATTVSNPPTTTQEIRSLEADLNRHTTLQYRAPEMVDIYSKRPVNERSDVWALGILLYKLCYYTTPFEEHGPLAILNVQYRIPSYPIYSQDMNMLIATMLRENGSQRPSVFELLNHVHRLRGTTSKYTYNIPVPKPLSPISQTTFRPSSSSNQMGAVGLHGTKLAIPLLETTVKPPVANKGIQAREKVLEAIAPMRRGRPFSSKESENLSSSRSSSPEMQKDVQGTNNWLESGFGAEQDKVWKSVADKYSSNGGEDGWLFADHQGKKGTSDRKESSSSFADDFSTKPWNSADLNSTNIPPRLSPRPNITVVKAADLPIQPLAFTGSKLIRPKQDRLIQNREKDAFEGLGLMTSAPKPAPTLGEARKLRTGLAIMSTQSNQSSNYYNRDVDNKGPGDYKRPSPSPQPKYLSTTPFQSQSMTPLLTSSSVSYHSARQSPSLPNTFPTSSSTNADGAPIESRFPSLEELDAQFNPLANNLYPSSVRDATFNYIPAPVKQSSARANYLSRPNNTAASSGNLLKPNAPNTSRGVDGIRSEQVTGVAMRDLKPSSKANVDNRNNISVLDPSESKSASTSTKITKPLVVKQRSTTSLRPSTSKEERKIDALPINDNLPPKSFQRPTVPPQDWLTGDHQDVRLYTSSEAPILRGSPSKRASFVSTNDIKIPSSSTVQHVLAPEHPANELLSPDMSPTVSKFKRAFPAIDLVDVETSHELPASELTDNQSPAATRREPDPDSSSAEEGPEEPRGIANVSPVKRSSKAKSRQSSVHELVHQYGGGLVNKEKDKERERTPSQYAVGDYVSSKPRLASLAPVKSDAAEGKTLTSIPPKSPVVVSKSHRQQNSVLQPPLQSSKPTSSRSRPQSMFIFPTKSTESPALSPILPQSNNFLPPQEIHPRPTRRTSISDMVQHYEAIGSSAKAVGLLSPGPSSPTYKAVSAKSTSTSATSLATANMSVPPIVFTSSKPATTPTSTDNSKSSVVDLSFRAKAEEETLHATGLTRTPTKLHKKAVSEKEPVSPSAEISTPRPRRISTKTNSNLFSLHTRPEPVSTRPTKVSLSSNSYRPPSSPRKIATSITDDSSTSAKSDDLSSSPERPYQGVGKLIDQWQKKSAEAEQGRPFVKKDIVLKRAMVHGSR